MSLQIGLNLGTTQDSLLATNQRRTLGPAQVLKSALVSEMRFSGRLLDALAVAEGDLYVEILKPIPNRDVWPYFLTRVNGETGDEVWRGGPDSCSFLGIYLSAHMVLSGGSGCSQSDQGGPSATPKDFGPGGWGTDYTTMVAMHDERIFFAHGPFGGYGDIPLTLESRDATTGAVQWVKDIPDRSHILAAGSTLYMRQGARLVARNVATGRIKWRWIPIQNASLSAATEEILFLSSGGSTFAVDAATQTPLWTESGGVMAILGSRIFLRDAEGIVARDLQSGSLLWSSNRAFTSAFAADGVVYGSSSQARTIVALRADDGAFLRSFTGEAAVVATGLLYVRDGRLIRVYGPEPEGTPQFTTPTETLREGDDGGSPTSIMEPSVLRVAGVQRGLPDCTITGTAGDDHLVGTPGADTICGLAGHDTLVGGSGSDSLIGGRGRDTADYSEAANPIVADLRSGAVTGWGSDELVEIENLVGSRDDDRLDGDELENTIDGGAGRDALAGHEARDRLNGGTGADRIYPGLGYNFVNGGGGSDTADYFFAPTENGLVISLSGEYAATGDEIQDILTSIENANGSRFSDRMYGSDQGDVLRGLDGNDSIYGQKANDLIEGGRGDDTLNGGDGVDECLQGSGTGSTESCERP